MRLALVLLLLLGACSSYDQDQPPQGSTAQVDEDEARPALSFTDWTEQTELFIELPTLVQGMDSPCAAHVTWLADFSAPASGRVTVVLRGGPREERFIAESPTVPGIFRPVVTPSAAGAQRMLVEVQLGEVLAVHDLGPLEVFASEDAARAAAGDEAEPVGRIPFLKEQQWPLEFGTQIVGEHSFRPAVRATGKLRSRDEGEIVVTAPVAGRIAGLGSSFPRIGASVAVEQPLFMLAPRLEASDQASLDLAVTSARLELSYAERERERLEALVREGAVPERRAVDARHTEDEARAALSAGERRLRQFRRVQRTHGGRSEGSLQVRAPLAGVIAAVDVAPGAFVEVGAPLLDIVDLERIWLEVHVPEADLAKVAVLHGAWFEIEGLETPLELGAETLVGRSTTLDPETRTLKILFAVQNTPIPLPLGAFARVHLVVGEAERALGIPPSALVDDGGQDVVYVQVEGEAFERRVVRLGSRDEGYVAVHAGLAAGEHVVTRGAWSIKLSAASGSVPAHGHAH